MLSNENTTLVMPWRWMALGLLLLNIAAGFGFLLSDPVVETDAPDMPPLAADVNQPPLVSEVSQFEPDASQAPACYSIGPLPTLLAQQRGEDRLRAFVSDLRLRQTTADHDRGWWVYLSTSSRSEALQLTRELAEADVEDYYVVAGGEMENAVSVGLFQSIENARRRQARMQELGFNAQMEVRRERIPQFWIDYRVTPGDEPPWRFILRASPGAQRMSIPCFTTSGDNATREPSA